MRRHSFIILFILFLMACTPQTINTPQLTSTSLPSTASEAQEVLIKYFDLLHSKHYAEADNLYGGDYEQLKVFSADVNPSDHAKLWANACELAGLRCLNVHMATLKGQEDDKYVFQVEFKNEGGSLFVLGPCCGANETEMPPVSQFEYTVIRNAEGKFVVMNLPPYTP